MMKQLKIPVMKPGKELLLAMSAAVLLGLWSCGQDACPPDNLAGGATEAPLRIAGTRTTGALASGDGVLQSPTDQLGLFRAEGNGYAAISNARYTYGAPLWTSDVQLVLNENNATLAAYYPYRKEATEVLTLRTQRLTPAEDLSATLLTTVNVNSPALKLELEHLYSRVRFQFSKQAGGGAPAYTGDGLVTRLRLSCAGLQAIAQYHLLSGVLETFPGSADMTGFTTRAGAMKGEAIDVEARTADCLVVPSALSALSGDLTFVATVDGKDMTATVSATALCGAEGKLMAGTQYVVKVAVKPTGLSVGKIETTEWTTATIDGSYDVN